MNGKVEGAVIDVIAPNEVHVSLYGEGDVEVEHFSHGEDGVRDALIQSLVLIERTNPGVLNDALQACRPEDVHNPNPEGLDNQEGEDQ